MTHEMCEMLLTKTQFVVFVIEMYGREILKK